MKKIYLDTSVPSAVFDLGKPERLKITKDWFLNCANKFELCTAEHTFREINELLSKEKRNSILKLIKDSNVRILPTNDSAFELSELYMQKGAIPPTEPEDALHIAVATVNYIPYFISWDFKHIVSKNPIKKILELNKKAGYNEIKIGSVFDFFEELC